MSEKTIGLIGIGMCAILLFGIFMVLENGKEQLPESEKVHTVSVTGTAQSKVAPDQAIIRLAVTTKSVLAKNAEEENSRIMNTIMKALQEQSLNEKDIVTEYYTIYPEYEYQPQTGRSTQRGYMAHHTVKVTIKDISKAGEIMDSAVNAGATNIDSVTFTLSEEKEKELRENLISEAASKARERAKSLVEALGARVGRVVSVSEASYTPPIFYARDMVAAKAEGAPNQIPSFNPEDVTVEMHINVEFEIE